MVQAYIEDYIKKSLEKDKAMGSEGPITLTTPETVIREFKEIGQDVSAELAIQIADIINNKLEAINETRIQKTM